MPKKFQLPDFDNMTPEDYSKFILTVDKETRDKIFDSKEYEVWNLKQKIKEGDTFYSICRHRTKTNMAGFYDMYLIRNNELLRYTWSIAKACGLTYNKAHEAIRINGCGFNRPDSIVENLSHTLFGKWNLLKQREL